MFLMVVIGYPFILASLFFIIHIEELSTLFKDLFFEIFKGEYLYMRDHISSYEVSDKPGKSILDVAQVLNMDSKGESSKTSSVNVDSTKGESSKSSNLEGRNLDSNNSRSLPEPLESRNLNSNNSKSLPDPLEARCKGKNPKFQIGLT